MAEADTLRTRKKQRVRSRGTWEHIAKTPVPYLMMALIIAWAIVFHYIPLYGITIAFKQFHPLAGFWSGKWIGFKYFKEFLIDPYALRIIKNTVVLGFYSLIFGFPMPIILALLLNEIRSSKYKKTIQTITYLPHFVSTVVVVGFIHQILNLGGVVNNVLAAIAGVRFSFLQSPRAFRPIYITSGIWQGVGWGSIIYLATLAGVNPELYEAAEIDGCSRWQKAVKISIPSILHTISLLFILSTKSIVSVGFEKAFLLQSPMTYETSDVIATYVFRRGIENLQYSYATAVGLMNSLVSFLMLWLTNTIVKRFQGETLW